MDTTPTSFETVKARCSNWVNVNVSSVATDSTFKKSTDYEYDYCNTDSEFDSVSECGKKRRRQGTQMKHEELNLTCAWKDCNFSPCSAMTTFVEHVSKHLFNIKVKVTDNNTEVYACQWKDCAFQCADADEITRHVNFHSFHTKLKCIGSNIRQRIKLPTCHRDPEWKNIIDVPSSHVCQWDECLNVFNNYYRFVNHVTLHIKDNPKGKNVQGGVKCRWTGCSSNFSTLYKLSDHMRCHTKEKIVACPHCGATFASNSKFHDHCRRQIPLEVQGFQCSHCYKYYPTENILRDHMRFHIFSYKCTMCDMSCESPASLAKHVRYRHISTRPYRCQLCSHGAKSQQDLDSHMTVHMNGPNFLCGYKGCTFTCKGAYALDRHVERDHDAGTRWYCCHECPAKYKKSYRLTKHLREIHNLQLLSGHKRFQYTRQEDGFYKLQMVRYETIDEESAGQNVAYSEEQVAEKKLKFEFVDTSFMPKIVITECDEEDTSRSSGDEKIKTETETCKNIDESNSLPVVSNILISIGEIDEFGNITEKDVVEAQQTTELPPTSEPFIVFN